MTATKTVIITGASRGIGATLAKRLAAGGLSVVINYNADAASAQTVMSDIVETGGAAITVQADISTPGGMVELFDGADAEFGSVDVLINNAGVFVPSTITETSDEAFSHHVSINLNGTFYGIREAARRLSAGGSVINFSSSVIGVNFPGYATYIATKSAVEGLTRVAAKELGAKGISVNCVAPGPVETELFLRGKSPELLEQLANYSPFGRLGQTDDIAEVVSFLCSPAARWVNGQVIRVNGGMN